MTTAILLFVYLGYLALRRATLDPVSRARRSAVYGVLAVVQLPVVHFSVLWWRSLHQPPTVLRPGDPWAIVLLLPDDGSAFEVDLDAEKRQLMGIQANDGERARLAVQQLRQLQRRFQG